MTPIEDHPLRYKLANELHARPFPSMRAPCAVAYVAFKQAEMAANRDRAQDIAHLQKLLDRTQRRIRNRAPRIITDRLAGIG